MTLPPRLLGYGAYNLCFDAALGQDASSAGPNFFEAIRQGFGGHPGWPMINLVKVICFRRATVDDFPPALGARLRRLYKLNIRTREVEINSAFLDNLAALVDQAQKNQFWVQVCIFHEQAIELADANGQPTELPEPVPPELNPFKPGRAQCQRLIEFFSPDASDRLERQKELVQAVGVYLRGKPNVLWEMGNELRIQKMPKDPCSDQEVQAANCRLAQWLTIMWTELTRALGSVPLDFTVSTGVKNEPTLFSGTGRDCPPGSPVFIPNVFDLHFGQWAGNIAGAVKRVQGYHLLGAPAIHAPVIINDDGAQLKDDTPQQKADAARLINQWAFDALQQSNTTQRVHFASKQQYPPGQPFDVLALDALRDASNGIRRR
jgi:hypothetical protein